MKIYQIQNTGDGSTAYLSSVYDYEPGDILYPLRNARPALQGHKSNRWRIVRLVRHDPIDEEV